MKRIGQIRRITYAAVDQHREEFKRGDYSVSEKHYTVRGVLDADGVWGFKEQNFDGTFDDFIGLRAPWSAEVVTYQQFTATMLRPDGYLPGVARPVMVYYPGVPGGPYFGTLGHWLTKDGDRMNGAWGDPSGRRNCANPRYSGL